MKTIAHLELEVDENVTNQVMHKAFVDRLCDLEFVTDIASITFKKEREHT